MDRRAERILSLQLPDGSWGYFHTRSEPKRFPYTTEMALRELHTRGFTIADAPIRRAVSYMNDCLTGAREIPDRREKLRDWDVFVQMMLAVWIRRFTEENAAANAVARTWCGILTDAFPGGVYSDAAYLDAFHRAFGMLPQGGYLRHFANFYVLSLTNGALDAATAAAVAAFAEKRV